MLSAFYVDYKVLRLKNGGRLRIRVLKCSLQDKAVDGSQEVVSSIPALFPSLLCSENSLVRQPP